METHSNILAWKIPWAEELGGLQSMGHKKSDMTKRVNTHTFTEEVYFSVLFFNCRHRWLYPGRATGREAAMRKFTLVNGSSGISQTTRFWRGFETLNVMWIHPLKLFTQQIFIKHESWADKRHFEMDGFMVSVKWKDLRSQNSKGNKLEVLEVKTKAWVVWDWDYGGRTVVNENNI